nr:DUF1579 family protein [Phormidesmis priestleyi]
MNIKPQKEHHWLQKLVGEWTYETDAIRFAKLRIDIIHHKDNQQTICSMSAHVGRFKAC